MNEDIFNELKEYYPDTWITRKDLKKITGGFMCARTMERLDSIGKGIKNRTLVGGKTVYHIDDVIEWLKNNAEIIDLEN